MRGPALFFLAAAVMVTAKTFGDLKFEVASVKPAGPEDDGPGVYRVGPGTDDPGANYVRAAVYAAIARRGLGIRLAPDFGSGVGGQRIFSCL